MKNVCVIFCLLFLGLSSMTVSQTATPPSGTGTSGDPYVISTLNELYWVTQNSSSWNKYFVQSADINASSTNTWDSDGSGGYYGFLPIGNTTTTFTGNYNGQGYAITGLYINRSSSTAIGFFGKTFNATISNIKLQSVSINGSATVGGVIGDQSGGTTTGCSTTGTVSAGTQDVGGIVGNGASGTVTECFSTCTVSSSNRVGGIVGFSSTAQITKCYSSGNISSTTRYAGGIVSITSADITNCYALGNISSGQNAGGIVGLINSTSASMTKCYSTGSVSGTASGGLVGWNKGTVNSSFWDTQTSGTATGYGTNEGTFAGLGKTTAEMKTQSMYTDSSWDFTTVWQMIGTNYPDLRSNPNPALPVELVSFNASIINGGILLKWNTATEQNNYGFEVERSEKVEGRSEMWSKIGFVEGNGTTNSPKSYSFVDISVKGKIAYRLKQIDRDGKFEYSQTIEVVVGQTPKAFALNQNYPNPFNPVTVISYQLPTTTHVSLIVFDAIGREVATLVNEVKETGSYNAVFDATSICSGIYFFQLKAGNFVQMRKMVLIK